ncbi:MAG: hypothetical protein RL701_4209 [Pseudomonadota bacterium]
MLQVEAKARRTQEERRTQTRRLLLEATLACLAELGYSGTTTLEVERRAGVSRGARSHHFQNKAELLASACDMLYERLSERYTSAFAPSLLRASARQRIRAGLAELFTIYQHAHFSAVIELWLAARTDPDLRAALKVSADRHRQLAIDAAAHLFPRLHASVAARLIESIHVAFVGLRMIDGVTGDAEHTKMVLTTLEDMIVLQVEREETSDGENRKQPSERRGSRRP